MVSFLRVLLPFACLLACACADGLGPEDVEALKQVEAHIEGALRDQQHRGDAAPSPDPSAGVYEGPIDSSVFAKTPVGHDDPMEAPVEQDPAPTEDTTPPPRTTTSPLLGDVRP